ncbi:hypothetical protein SAMN04487894_102459 [Niabella drilacis]|uniref:Neutral/alkaline non-lysosomal ceramidase, N-terminal n=2 Tax=Niabella drilacis (strain DSM 25811 / CCM 8410 / CCUG 62505 / LMG 26954 / E90) TaxID=1285928 RepID=A0A1G6LTS8_NIADE|nr:hypothetical protein SAMN04487894_102459 [Niabella drilacis]
MLSAGTATTEITPPVGSIINGDFFSHRAQSVGDPLYAKAIVLQSGAIRFALVMVDTCSLTYEFLGPVKQQIEAITGIPQQHQLIAATHIHSGGSVNGIFLSEVDTAYCALLGKALVQVVAKAFECLTPCMVAYGSVPVPEHMVCRRYHMKKDFTPFDPFGKGTDRVVTNPFGYEDQILEQAGETDPELAFMALRSLEGTWLAVLANYSLHYVGDFSKTVVSADYFGHFARSLKERLGAGADFVALMSNGTSGNINIWDFLNPHRYPGEPFEKSRLIGRELAAHIVDCLPQLQWDAAATLSAGAAVFELPVRKPGHAALMRAQQQVEGGVLEGRRSLDRETVQRIYAREQLLLAAEPDHCPVYIQGVRIGAGRIGAFPGELFAETGLWLKERFRGTPYFTICLANGNIGYAPPPHELEAGGYETWRCRTSKQEAGAEPEIKSRMEQLLKGL